MNFDNLSLDDEEWPMVDRVVANMRVSREGDLDEDVDDGNLNLNYFMQHVTGVFR